MKTRQLIFIVLLAMLATACSDQTRQTHTLTGKIFFKDSMEPMDNIVLSLYQNNGKEGFQLDVIGETQLTAADGGYSFDIQPFKNGEAGDIILSAGATTGFSVAFNQLNFTFPIVYEKIDPALIVESETYTYDFFGEAFGFLEIEFRGNTELFVGDELTLEIVGDGYAYRTPFQVADDLKKIYTYPVKGNVKTQVSWETRIRGLVNKDQDSVFCPNRELTRLRVNL
jgi:hypothetical protein